MDKVYVVYLDGKMLSNGKNKATYLEERYARQVITTEAKSLAVDMHIDENNNIHYWYELDKLEKMKWLDKAKSRFCIKEFTEYIQNN